MSELFGLTVRFYLRPGTEKDFDELVSETIAGIKANEPGTLIYASHPVEGHPEQRVFYELYRDRAAFDEHEQQPHIRRFLELREQYVLKFDVDFLAVLAAKGIPDREVK